MVLACVHLGLSVIEHHVMVARKIYYLIIINNNKQVYYFSLNGSFLLKIIDVSCMLMDPDFVKFIFVNY